MKRFRMARKIATEILLALLAWLFIAPLALLVPRKSRSVVVLGRQYGQFLDNAKYFYRYGAESDNYMDNVIFLSADVDLCANLARLGGRAETYPSVKGAWALLRAQVVVYDSVEWIRRGRLQFAFCARKVQLWHGAPLKQIELPLHRQQLAGMKPLTRRLYAFQMWVTARYLGSDLLISTSRYFTEHAFLAAIKAKDILASGYPRNDVLAAPDPAASVQDGLLGLNTDARAIERIEAARREDRKIILYMPTFRKDWKNQFDSGVLNIARLAAFAKQNNILLVFKFHPLMAGYCNQDELRDIVQYEPDADIYPLLPLCDCLISDYSSIYFDYLLLDKPILFFPYDYDEYTSDDRHLLFDYQEITPGRKCYDQEALEQAVHDVLAGIDDYKESRRIVLDKVFDHRDANASARIWRYIETNYFC